MAKKPFTLPVKSEETSLKQYSTLCNENNAPRYHVTGNVIKI